MDWRYRMRPEMADYDDVFQVGQILKRVLVRCEQGQKEYGTYKPETETRDMYEETEQELLDAIVYLCFEIIRLRCVRERVKAIEQQ